MLSMQLAAGSPKRYGTADSFANTTIGNGSRLRVIIRVNARMQDEILRQGVCQHGPKQWRVISNLFSSRSPTECSQRWRELQSHDAAITQTWLSAEDSRLREYVACYGSHKWSIVASYMPGRTAKQCRER